MSEIFPFSSRISGTPEGRAGEKIVRILQERGYKAFFAGGAPRDMLLGKAPHDIDIATSARPEEIQAIFPDTLALGVSFGVISIRMDGIFFETATLREEREYSDGRRPDKVFYTDNEKLDVERRDFTINAILYDPVGKVMIDHTGGRADLYCGILRTVGDPERRFSEDYLRILRAVRFAFRYGFRIEEKTECAMKKYVEKLQLLSRERIREELEKMLTGPRAAEAFRKMETLGVLKVILPEVHALAGVEQPPQFHPEGDVFTHTMIMLEKACHPSPELAWSILLHDIGKAVSRNVTPDGVTHFYGHEATGGTMALRVMKSLRVSNHLAELVSKTVREHMRYATADKMRKSTWKKMIADPGFSVGMELHRVDCASSHGKLGNYILMLDRLSESDPTQKLPDPLLDGNDLIALGLKPGPKIRVILEKIRDSQLEGTLSSHEDAIEYAKKLIRKDDNRCLRPANA